MMADLKTEIFSRLFDECEPDLSREDLIEIYKAEMACRHATESLFMRAMGLLEVFIEMGLEPDKALLKQELQKMREAHKAINKVQIGQSRTR